MIVYTAITLTGIQPEGNGLIAHWNAQFNVIEQEMTPYERSKMDNEYFNRIIHWINKQEDRKIALWGIPENLLKVEVRI